MLGNTDMDRISARRLVPPPLNPCCLPPPETDCFLQAAIFELGPLVDEHFAKRSPQKMGSWKQIQWQITTKKNSKRQVHLVSVGWGQLQGPQGQSVQPKPNPEAQQQSFLFGWSLLHNAKHSSSAKYLQCCAHHEHNIAKQKQQKPPGTRGASEGGPLWWLREYFWRNGQNLRAEMPPPGGGGERLGWLVNRLINCSRPNPDVLEKPSFFIIKKSWKKNKKCQLSPFGCAMKIRSC